MPRNFGLAHTAPLAPAGSILIADHDHIARCAEALSMPRVSTMLRGHFARGCPMVSMSPRSPSFSVAAATSMRLVSR